MITIITNATCTFYLATGNPCANGHFPTTGYTIAAPRCIPLGTKVSINGHNYTVEDRTNIRYDGRWDIFVNVSYKEALKLGKQTNNVTIKEQRNK